ncbi:MAG TPA: hypothetical protein VFU04_05420 [Solirubrobacterales bacterium]|nr:hypothetical protein [Solirubrobacterales bacterium]
MNAPDEPSAAAERARESLREEIAGFRTSIDEMLAQQGSGGRPPDNDRLAHTEERLLRLEGRVDQIEQERRFAEWRMYSNVEKLLDDLLRELRSIADRLSR